VQPRFAYHESVWPKLVTAASSTSPCRVGTEVSIEMDFMENATRSLQQTIRNIQVV
jgi:hypothetical protein